jgi:hypothetical protein
MIFLCIPCLVLLIYFVILGFFFPKYHGYIREAWECFYKKLIGKKCSISFDNRMRIKLSMWLSKNGFSRLGKFLYKKKNFDMILIVIGIVFTILTIWLMIVFIQFLIKSPCEDPNSPICPL